MLFYLGYFNFSTTKTEINFGLLIFITNGKSFGNTALYKFPYQNRCARLPAHYLSNQTGMDWGVGTPHHFNHTKPRRLFKENDNCVSFANEKLLQVAIFPLGICSPNFAFLGLRKLSVYRTVSIS